MEPTTTTILLIILGAVSFILIVILVVIGFQIWKLVRTLQHIATVFSDEADHAKNIVTKVRKKIHSVLGN
jgi:hypothetical protein